MNKANFYSMHSGNISEAVTNLRTTKVISTTEHCDAMNVKQVKKPKTKDWDKIPC